MDNYTITKNQKEDFNENGFLLLPNAIPGHLLSRWQDLLDELNNDLLKEYSEISYPRNATFIGESQNPLLSRVNDLLGFYPEAVLDLMSCSSMMNIAKTFCGTDTIPLHCDALFKQKHAKSVVLWHQDAIYPRTSRYINIGIYLDDAGDGDGCLNYVPKTQDNKQDICELVSKYGWDVPGKISIPVKAGDILIQDMMVLHGSQMKINDAVRRTIYVEMRPAEAILEQRTQSEKWVALKKRWMGIIVRKANPKWFKEFQSEVPKDLKTDAEEIDEILKHRESRIPANYCYENIKLQGYPI